MALTSELSEDKTVLTIELDKTFDFSKVQDFSNTRIQRRFETVVIDLREMIIWIARRWVCCLICKKYW